MIKPSRYYLVWHAVFAVLFCLLLPMSIVYAVDPMQFFRRAPYEPAFSTNERYQLPGLARNYDYDTVIVGTSMAQNFYPSYADKVLGGRVLKLAMSGSSAHEQFLILNVAIQTGRVKRVLWGVDQWVFRGPPDRVRDDLGAFPYFLYEQNPLGRFWYLFNGTILSQSFDILRDRKRLFGVSDGSVPDAWNTFDKFYEFNRSRAVGDYFNPLNFKGLGEASMLASTDLAVMEKSFGANLIDVVRSHPGIAFDIYFPPYSILNAKFYSVYAPEMYRRMIAFQNVMIRKLMSFSNVRLFDFSDVTEITENLDLYKDMGHYNVSVNEWILRSIAAGNHRVEAADPEASTRRLQAQVSAYMVPNKP